MNAKKCDRCGKLYEFYKIAFEGEYTKGTAGIIKIGRTQSGCRNEVAEYELCRDCADSFFSWLKEGNQNENETEQN
jgi:hypothetical protein